MVRQKVVISNPTGLHLRPAGLFCNMANKFDCKVMFEYDNTSANAKSVLSVLGACIKSGDEITLVCDGNGEEDALKAMVEAVESGLGE
ncbi:HPr family phosphocarrier protein [Lachnospiraceae bacterium 42-17]|jgi:phosphocarrier protein HPr|nr:HPr family phosphocarrier protein [Dorea sp.]